MASNVTVNEALIDLAVVSDNEEVSLTSTPESEPQEYYNVDQVLGEREVEDNGERVMQYLVQWEGYPLDRCTWETADSFQHEATMQEWEEKKSLIREGAEQAFDVDALCELIEKKVEATEKRKAIRRRKKARLGFTVTVSASEESSATESDSDKPLIPLRKRLRSSYHEKDATHRRKRENDRPEKDQPEPSVVGKVRRRTTTGSKVMRPKALSGTTLSQDRAPSLIGVEKPASNPQLNRPIDSNSVLKAKRSQVPGSAILSNWNRKPPRRRVNIVSQDRRDSQESRHFRNMRMQNKVFQLSKVEPAPDPQKLQFLSLRDGKPVKDDPATLERTTKAEMRTPFQMIADQAKRKSLSQKSPEVVQQPERDESEPLFMESPVLMDEPASLLEEPPAQAQELERHFQTMESQVGQAQNPIDDIPRSEKDGILLRRISMPGHVNYVAQAASQPDMIENGSRPPADRAAPVAHMGGSNLSLSDPRKRRMSFTLPSRTVVEPGSFVALDEEARARHPPVPNPPSLSLHPRNSLKTYPFDQLREDYSNNVERARDILGTFVGPNRMTVSAIFKDLPGSAFWLFLKIKKMPHDVTVTVQELCSFDEYMSRYPPTGPEYYGVGHIGARVGGHLTIGAIANYMRSIDKGGIFNSPYYSMVIYPVGLSSWSAADAHFEGPQLGDFRFLLRTSLPQIPQQHINTPSLSPTYSLPQLVNISNQQTSIESKPSDPHTSSPASSSTHEGLISASWVQKMARSEDPIALLKKHFDIDYHSLLPAEIKHHVNFFLSYPSHLAAEEKVLVAFLQNVGVRHWSSSQEGDWDNFSTNMKAGVILIHHSMDKIHKMANLAVLLAQSHFNFFRISLQPADPSIPRIQKIFPLEGQIFVLPDTLFILKPSAARHILRWFRKHILEIKSPRSCKFVVRPGIRDFIGDLHKERVKGGGEERNVYAEIYSELSLIVPMNDLDELNDFKTPKDISHQVSPDLIPGYSLSATSTSTRELAEDVETNDSLLLNWFCNWTLDKFEKYRKFYVMIEEQKMRRQMKADPDYNHMMFFAPDVFIHTFDVKMMGKKKKESREQIEVASPATD